MRLCVGYSLMLGRKIDGWVRYKVGDTPTVQQASETLLLRSGRDVTKHHVSRHVEITVHAMTPRTLTG